MPKVSVIVPVYRAEKYINRCIESVLSQTLSEWELILVDDCGGDNSMNIVRKYVEQDGRIKYIESDKNHGPMIARETGYLASSGDYITFLDSDDTLPKNSLETFYLNAVQSNADITVGEAFVVETNGNKVLHRDGLVHGIFDKATLIPFLVDGSFPHNLWGKLFRAELLRGKILKNYDGCTNGEDGLLFYQILENVEVVSVIGDEVYDYWMNEDSSTHKPLNEKMITGMARLEKFKMDFFLKEGVSLNKSYYHYLYGTIANLAMRYPKFGIVKIYNEQGVELDLSISNLCHYFKGIELLKILIKTFVYYRIKLDRYK